MNSSIDNIAIIMDGNGRWAKLRGKPRFWGHIKGTQNVNSIVSKASELSLKSLTLYAFSTENWNRPEEEVTILLKLLKRFLKREYEKIQKENICFQVIGDYSNLDTKTQELVYKLESATKNNTGLNLNIAFNYGGRKEIVDSVNKINKDNSGSLITEDLISKNLYNNKVCDVDLVIRTGGDHRISNFLLWQSSYAEICFVDDKWPDFSARRFEEIIKQYSKKERRFGGLK
jgi:undecaprenyl diphosphate synthase